MGELLETIRIDLVDGTKLFHPITPKEKRKLLRKFEDFEKSNFPFLSFKIPAQRFVFVNTKKIKNIIFCSYLLDRSEYLYKDNFMLLEDNHFEYSEKLNAEVSEYLPDIVLKLSNSSELMIIDEVDQGDNLLWLNDELEEYNQNPYGSFFKIIDDEEDENYMPIDEIVVLEIVEHEINPIIYS